MSKVVITYNTRVLTDLLNTKAVESPNSLICPNRDKTNVSLIVLSVKIYSHKYWYSSSSSPSYEHVLGNSLLGDGSKTVGEWGYLDCRGTQKFALERIRNLYLADLGPTKYMNKVSQNPKIVVLSL